jgi:hypothetical protein
LRIGEWDEAKAWRGPGDALCRLGIGTGQGVNATQDDAPAVTGDVATVTALAFAAQHMIDAGVINRTKFPGYRGEFGFCA